jgi:hypothetical protein
MHYILGAALPLQALAAYIFILFFGPHIFSFFFVTAHYPCKRTRDLAYSKYNTIYYIIFAPDILYLLCFTTPAILHVL